MIDSSAPLPVAIAGAGIAGLSSAIALTLAGVPVRVFEQADRLEPIGAGIQLGPNATRILDQWDVALSPAACEPEAIELRSARSGKILNAIPLGSSARERYGAPYMTLLRADLHSALLARAKGLGVAMELGCPVSAVHEQQSSLIVQTGKGGDDASCFEASGLIAADGVNSSLRCLVPGSRRPFYTKTTAWRALIPARAFPAPIRQVITLWMGPAAHLVHYPVSGTASLNAVLAIDDNGPYRARAGRMTQTPSGLVPHLKTWNASTIAVIDAAPEWQAWPVFEVPTGGDSGGRRVQLIGDAWHAMRPYLASGGAMAIEDAAAMARAFGQARHSVPRALYLFRLERGPRVKLVASQAIRMGRIYHLAQPYATARDAVIQTRSGSALLKGNDWLYGA